MDLRSFLASFKPHPLQTSFPEQLRSGLAGGLAILLLMLILQTLPQTLFPLLIVASMASSAALLYAAPHSPLSQPWNLVGGHVVSAVAGLLCSALIPDPVLASGASVGLAILAMQLLACLHPPSASTALMMVLGDSQFHTMPWTWALALVAINAGISLLLALIINNRLPGRRYPMPQHASAAQPVVAATIEHSDLSWALEQMDSVIDVSEEDLEAIYQLAVQHARSRHAAR